jgi:circadian clock protein KaiC
MRVVKLREVAFRGGYHDLVIRRGGVVIYPRLIANEHEEPFKPTRTSSGIAALDTLLGGGLDRGTSTLILGPAGSGKSALASQYAVAAAAREESVAIFTFDEGLGTLFGRAEALGMDMAGHVARGRITVQQVDPAELSPGEFVHIVRHAVEQGGARVVIIDSLNGYLHAMPEERFIQAQLHELLSYLRRQGVVAIMVVAQHGLVGNTAAPIDVSYLADSVLLTRYFEAGGRVRKAISVMKKRSGHHEDTIRELALGVGGIILGPPLDKFHGVLTGVPIYDEGGAPRQLLER